MEIKRRKRARNSMSITPLVDVVFLLLLFFALTLHFSPEEAISVELPTSSSAKQQSETEIIPGRGDPSEWKRCPITISGNGTRQPAED